MMVSSSSQQQTIQPLTRTRLRLLPGRQKRLPSHTLQQHVADVADMLASEMAIWQIEPSTDIKVYIARGCQKELYRGFLLCADEAEHTFLLDTQALAYVTAAGSSLLQIDGLPQARHFVDVLHLLQFM